MPLATWFDVEWIALDNPESPNDDLRARGYEKVLPYSLAVKVYIGVKMSFILLYYGGQSSSVR